MNASRTNVLKCGDSICPGYKLGAETNKTLMHRRQSLDKPGTLKSYKNSTTVGQQYYFVVWP